MLLILRKISYKILLLLISIFIAKLSVANTTENEKAYELFGNKNLPSIQNLKSIGVSEFGVNIWGSGKPMREFMWSEDMANACIHIMENVNFSDLHNSMDEVRNTHINIGTGEEISIEDLAKLIAQVIGYRGDFHFDSSKPDGTMRKLTDVSKLHSLGYKHEVSLQEGIGRVYAWYLENSSNAKH